MNNSTRSTTHSGQIIDTPFIFIHGASVILGLPLNVYIMFLHFGMTARSLFKCLVCLERYVAVVHLVTFLKFRPVRYRIVPSIISWTISLGSGITAIMTYPNLPYRPFIAMYLIVLILDSFSCLSVLEKLKHPVPGDGVKKREDGARKRAFKIITFNLLAFLIQTIFQWPSALACYCQTVFQGRTMNNFTNSTTDPWQMAFSPIILIHCVNLILGIPLNAYIMVLHFGKYSKDPSDIFTFNQAAAEIFFMLVSPFHIMCNITLELCFYNVVGFFLICGMCVRALFQCLVCLERYVAVVHPVTFLKSRPPRYRVVPSAISWTIGLGCGITGMLTFPNLPYKYFIGIYLMVLILDSFSCLSVLKKLKHPGPGDGDKKREDGAKKRAFETIFFNLLTFLIQNIPVTMCFVIQDKLSPVAFNTGKQVSLALNLFTGLIQVGFMLHRAGKLKIITCT